MKETKSTEVKPMEKVKLNNYHSVETLKKMSKGKQVTYVLPNGKEYKVNGK